MQTILVLTVGGSHQPLLRSIGQNQPDFVHFLCSGDGEGTPGSYVQVDGQGKVLKSRFDAAHPDLPNLVTLANLKAGQYKIHRIDHFDNLNDCYLTAIRLIELLHAEHPQATVIADYTGGTKSMTAGLAAAALDDGRCDIQLVTGQRQDLRAVKDQTEFARPMQVWDAQTRRRMATAKSLIARFDYAGAAEILEEAARRFASDTTIEQLQRWITLCRAFDAWDKFDHARAQQLLQPYRGLFDSHKTFLALMVEGRGHGFELVEDLLLNAERRATRGRHDDAVGRCYRALELTAQTWLRQRWEIDTSSVDLSRIPESIKPRLSVDSNEGEIKLSLVLAWDTIAAMQDDPLGALFAGQRARLLSFLSLRNQSLFAHGQRPIREEDYHQLALVAPGFVAEAVDLALASLGKRRLVVLTQLPVIWD